MTETMKIEIDWYESIDYRSVIEVDRAEFLEWLDGSEVTGSKLIEFLESHRDGEFHWFQLVDATKDFTGVSDRGLNGVNRILDDPEFT